ncbi:helix-turn-helix domain-containing protein [Faecalicoccus acidiformans]|uniref:helix-turn-helix domain-containing protein n=1 Tax=Faecalicoccus acidiformans TaxID=915173 RepID=UPI00235649B4|nr:helix-turn-helix domain-containing protein [Faecalicoccus acidiformans]
MFDLKKLKKLKGFSSEIIDTNQLTTKEFVKNLRNELNLSQSLFAEILGISEKTVEKWEQGANPVKGAASRLLYLLDKNKELINDLYIIDGVLTESDLKMENKDYDTYMRHYSFNNYWKNMIQYYENSETENLDQTRISDNSIIIENPMIMNRLHLDA